MSSRDLNLLFPEWQGHGENDAVYRGAQEDCARELFAGVRFATVPVRLEERLEVTGAYSVSSRSPRACAMRGQS